MRRLGGQLVDEVPGPNLVVVLDELLQRRQGTILLAVLQVLENHRGNNCPNHDDEGDKDRHREVKPPSRSAIDGIEPFVVSFFDSCRKLAVPHGLAMQAMKFLSGPAGRDGVFQVGDRGLVPRPAAANSSCSRSQLAQRRLPGRATDRQIFPRLQTTCPIA